MTQPFAVALEIIRHRIQTACENATISIARISGSPIAVEANDMNTAIMDETGAVVACGRYTMLQIGALQHLVEKIIAIYGDDPGIAPGDMYLCNDPYVGAIHLPDVGVVAPVFFDGRLVAWVGSVVHQLDIGGPHSGGLNPSARDIFEEGAPIPPVRIVENDQIRPDIEAGYLRRSRAPHLLALDLRGQVAANRTSRGELEEICRAYGPETLRDALRQLLASAEAQIRRRLAALPDGCWREVCFLDVRHGDERSEPDAVRLTMTKRGDSLHFDFSDSSEQLRTPANLTPVSLESMVNSALMPLLAYGLPWVMGGIRRAVEVYSRPGTITSCTWPAATGHGPTSTGQAVRACMSSCIGRLLDGSAETEHAVMAGCMTAGAGHAALSGLDEDGTPFEAMLLDGTSGGMGARGADDGLDSAGVISSIGMLFVNAEVAEANYPVRYERRTERIDSGGAGRHRGGVGGLFQLQITSPSVTCTGLEFAATSGAALGAAGGSPGMLGATLLQHEEEVPRGIRGDVQTALGDRVIEAAVGGGGVGDPLDRYADAVQSDVVEGLVSVAAAAELYGVVVDDQGVVDRDATATRRRAIREERVGRRSLTEPVGTPRGERVSRSLSLVVGNDGRAMFACRRCDYELGPASGNVKDHLALRERPIVDTNPDAAYYEPGPTFVTRTFCCPHCAALIDVERNVAGAPFVWSVDVSMRLPTEQAPAGDPTADTAFIRPC